MGTKRYKYYQPNRKDIGDSYDDCGIRALCRDYEKAWLIVFDKFIPISCELQTPMRTKQCYEECFFVTMAHSTRGSKATL